jgi:hypothetical protein
VGFCAARRSLWGLSLDPVFIQKGRRRRRRRRRRVLAFGVLGISGCGSQAFLFVHRFMDLGFIVVVDESCTNVL